MKNTHFNFSLFALPLVLALGGCAGSLGVQKSDFACAGMPEGVRCLGVQDVYKATEQNDHVNGAIALAYKRSTEGTVAADGKAANGAAPVAVPVVTHTVPAADTNVPLRMAAKVMRIWVNAFEDEDGDLAAGQYIFTEIEPRRWSIGGEARNDGASGLSPMSSGTRNTVRDATSPLAALPSKK